jgi:hypothetical protein
MDVSDPSIYNECIVNEEPIFVDYLTGNYQPDTLSPLIDKGNPAVITESFFDLHRDIIENTRPTDLPDIGAYEYLKPE